MAKSASADQRTPEDPGSLLERLNVSIDEDLLVLALTHRSYAYENGGGPTNERLEFLGDSVLGLTITDALYRGYPDLPEGDLARRRAAVVSTQSLAAIARELGVGRYILLGKGEQLTRGWDKTSILADTFEALIGAAYLSCGMSAAQEFVMRLIGTALEDVVTRGAATDWKTSMQEYAAGHQLGPVTYEVVGEGPDHSRSYEATLVMGPKRYCAGRGGSKKEAEQRAAAATWSALVPMQEAEPATAGESGATSCPGVVNAEGKDGSVAL